MYRAGILVIAISIFANFMSAQACETCGWATPLQPTKESQSLQCEDLYKAVCLNSNGSLKHNSKEEDVPAKKEMEKFIQAAREKAGKAQGHTTYVDFLTSQLEKAGLPVHSKLSPEAQKLLTDKELVGVEVDDLVQVFPQYSDCAKSASAQVEKVGDEKQTVETLLKSNHQFIEQRLATTKSLYQKSIPLFVNRIAALCKATGLLMSQMGEMSDSALGNQGTHLKSICKDQLTIRNQAMDIYRKQGSAEYAKLSEAFVNKYFSIFNFIATNNNPKSEEEKAEVLQEQVKYIQGICLPVGDLVSTQGRSTLVSLKEKLSSSRVVVESLIDRVYSASRKKLVESMYKRITKELLAFLERSKVQASEIAKIKADYDSIVLSWLEKPAPESYLKDAETGLELLPPNKSPNEEIGKLYDLGVFNDQDLEFFTTYNASYMPTIHIGKMAKPSNINLMPLMLEYLDRNPWTIFETLSHEAGHNVGPQISQINGYNINQHYTDVLACYSSTDSLKLVQGQEDETISDYLASEVLAVVVNDLPADRRVAAIYSAQQFSCEAESWAVLDGDVSFKSFGETHPTMRLRIAAIQGANPNLRKHMGCQSESKQFRTCSM